MWFVPLMNAHRGRRGWGWRAWRFLLPPWVRESAAERAAATFSGRRWVALLFPVSVLPSLFPLLGNHHQNGNMKIYIYIYIFFRANLFRFGLKQVFRFRTKAEAHVRNFFWISLRFCGNFSLLKVCLWAEYAEIVPDFPGRKREAEFLSSWWSFDFSIYTQVSDMIITDRSSPPLRIS